MSINAEVFIRRNKLRRQFETEFHKINASIKAAAKEAGVDWFHIKYSHHLLDRAIQREIDEKYVFSLFHKLHAHVKEVAEFLAMPARPDTEEELQPGVEYRPLRLEITDGTLWLGLTVSHMTEKFSNHSLQCRMAFINSNRFEGKTSKKVIKIKEE